MDRCQIVAVCKRVCLYVFSADDCLYQRITLQECSGTNSLNCTQYLNRCQTKTIDKYILTDGLSSNGCTLQIFTSVECIITDGLDRIRNIDRFQTAATIKRICTNGFYPGTNGHFLQVDTVNKCLGDNAGDVIIHPNAGNLVCVGAPGWRCKIHAEITGTVRFGHCKNSQCTLGIQSPLQIGSGFAGCNDHNIAGFTGLSCVRIILTTSGANSIPVIVACCRNFFLDNQNLATDSTLLTIRQTGFDTGSSYTRDKFLRMTQGRNHFLRNNYFTTGSTSPALRQTGFRTGSRHTGNNLISMRVPCRFRLSRFRVFRFNGYRRRIGPIRFKQNISIIILLNNLTVGRRCINKGKLINTKQSISRRIAPFNPLFISPDSVCLNITIVNHNANTCNAVGTANGIHITVSDFYIVFNCKNTRHQTICGHVFTIRDLHGCSRNGT